MKGKVAIVTGGASGIGFAIVESLAQAGVNCVIADMDVPGGERAEAQLKQAGFDSLFVKTNVCSPDDVRHLVDAAVEKFGRLDIMVNNAGLQHVAPIVDFPEERWNLLIGVMLTGTFLCCKYALPHMIQQKWGRIINVNSIHGKVASPFKVAYVSAKHGVLGLTKVVALEVAENNITCNAICPAYVRTPLVERQIADQARHNGISEEDVIQKIMLVPAAIRRLLDASEVASLVRYLCTDEAAGITGTALDIDLGWMAR
ncbi:MAG: 3-hydroxybutyrate dehydrogenase [Terracidiphilus sp.]|jgi:3-hydroxybutyrate dehydrogenase